MSGPAANNSPFKKILPCLVKGFAVRGALGSVTVGVVAVEVPGFGSSDRLHQIDVFSPCLTVAVLPAAQGGSWGKTSSIKSTIIVGFRRTDEPMLQSAFIRRIRIPPELACFGCRSHKSTAS
jgi:hypothetical protein